MVITFYLRSRLWPFKDAENPIPETTDDKFLIQIPVYSNESKIKAIIKKTDFYDISVIQGVSNDETHEEKNNVQSNVQLSESDLTIGFVFHSRKYSDGSSNLRIQFTKGRGLQYAKNSGLRIFRKYWISKKNEVSNKHPESKKINNLLSDLKDRISLTKKMFIEGTVSYEEAYKEILIND